MKEEEIAFCLPLLRQAEHVVVFTGFWALHDPMNLATPDAFERDPGLVWGWYEWRRQQLRHTVPNKAHVAISRLAAQVPRFTLITQNVDDLHERAGSTNVIHLHGDLQSPRCSVCAAPMWCTSILNLNAASTHRNTLSRVPPRKCYPD